jgi:hypothetical protein
MSVLCSVMSSLQQTPSARECLAHWAAVGACTPGAEASIAHIGGFLWFAVASGRGGRRTAVDEGEEAITQQKAEAMLNTYNRPGMTTLWRTNQSVAILKNELCSKDWIF